MSRVSEPTITRLESLDGNLGGREETGDKIRSAIEAAGIQFIDDNEGGEGARFRKPRRRK